MPLRIKDKVQNPAWNILSLTRPLKSEIFTFFIGFKKFIFRIFPNSTPALLDMRFSLYNLKKRE